jgi:hypothetical protein
MSIRPISLRAARWIVAAGAIALAVFMFFFNWYGGSVSGLPHGARLTGATLSSTGWQTFTVSRWIWLLTILVALGSVLATANGYKDDGRLRSSALVAGFGALASALIVIRIVHHPGLSTSSGPLHVSYGIKAGIWLGLVAALAITFGGYAQTLPEKPQAATDAASEDPAAAFSGLTVPGSLSESGSTASPASAQPPTETAASSEPAEEPAPPST